METSSTCALCEIQINFPRGQIYCKPCAFIIEDSLKVGSLTIEDKQNPSGDPIEIPKMSNILFNSEPQERRCEDCSSDISNYPLRFKQCNACFKAIHNKRNCDNCGITIDDTPFHYKYCSTCYPSIFPTHNTVESTCFTCEKRFLSLSIDVYKTLCPTCRPVNVDKVEDMLFKQKYSKAAITWLNSIMAKEGIHIQHALNGGEHTASIGGYTFSFDGYCKETNTVYEFYGDKWHGNPRVYGAYDILVDNKPAIELYRRTKWREKEILKAGYNLVTMWEHDFNSKYVNE